MDIRAFFQEVRDVEATLRGAFVVISSLATPNGGRAGVLVETGRAQAAILIAERKARVATEEEAEGYHAEMEAARIEFEQRAQSSLRVAVLSEEDVRALRPAAKKRA